MKPFFIAIIFLLFVLVLDGWALVNADFEIADPNPPPGLNFTPPAYWQYENYAGIHSSFVPDPEHGRTVLWSIPNPYQGSKFLLLSTGDIIYPDGDDTIRTASVMQPVFLNAGSRISGAYFFGTCDYRPYNDYGTVCLVPNDPNNYPGLSEIVLVDIDVLQVGDYQATESWLNFEYTILPEQQGSYDLLCSVSDFGDTIYKSYLALDAFSICGPGVLHGDANFDCRVDLLDLNILSHCWLTWCPDPNTIDPNSPIITDPNFYPPVVLDPNYPCYWLDCDGNEFIDPNDLPPFTENWLLSIP